MSKFAKFLETLNAEYRLNGVLDNAYHSDLGLSVHLTDRGFDGLTATFSTDDNGLDGTWVVSVYDGDEFKAEHSWATRIPNGCQDKERLAAWVKGVVAALSNPTS